MTDHPAERSPLLRATNLMLDELAELRRRERGLERQLSGLRTRIDALLAPLTAALGVVSRAGHATYAIHRYHPELLAQRLEAARDAAPEARECACEVGLR